MTEVFGFLSASATIDLSNPVEFWASGNYVGTANTLGQVTDSVVLPAGEHVLQSVALGGRHEGRHSAWALRSAMHPSKHPQLAVLAIGCYQEDEVPRHIGSFARSAKKQGIWLTVKGIGTDYISHFHTKILRLRDWIADLPSDVTHVLYTDAKDSTFAAGPARIMESFRSLETPLLASAECCCFPEQSVEWTSRFPQLHRGRNWICAGSFMGERSALMAALDQMREMSDKLSRGDFDFASIRPWWHGTDNDQWYWQAAHSLNLFPVVLDARFSVFATVCCEGHYQLIENPVFSLEPGRIVDKTSGESPCVLHFSGAYDRCMHQWAGYLDLI